MNRHGHWREDQHPRDGDGQFTDGPPSHRVSVSTRTRDGAVSHDPGRASTSARQRDVAEHARVTVALPADPLAALLDPGSDVSTDTILDHLAAGHGTSDQRRQMVEALAEFKRMARNIDREPVDGITDYQYRTQILGQVETAPDPDAFARQVLDLLGDAPNHRAALLEAIYARRRADTTGTVGMAGGPRFATEAEARTWADANMAPPHLSDAQTGAVHDYTGGGGGPSSRTVNERLRFGAVDPEWADRIDTNIGHIDAALAASRTPAPLLLMRSDGDGVLPSLGIDPPGTHGYDPVQLAALAGTVVSDDGYLSTSIGRTPGGVGVASGLVTWAIRAPAGTPALYLGTDDLTAYHSEREVLVPRGSRRVIHAVYRGPDPSDRRLYIEAEIVPANWAPPPGWAPSPTGDMWKEYVR